MEDVCLQDAVASPCTLGDGEVREESAAIHRILDTGPLCLGKYLHIIPIEIQIGFS